MSAGTTGWRRVAGILATLALVLTMFAPPAQAAPCTDDLDVAAAAAGQPAAPGVETPGEPCDEGCCPCVCCHTHAVGAIAPAEGPGLAAPSQAVARHVPAEAAALTSKPPFGLERPPRV